MSLLFKVCVKSLSVLGACGMIAACAVGPDYKTPAWVADVQGTMAEVPDEGPDDSPETGAWYALADAPLQALLNQALAHNADIAIATANLQRAATFLRDTILDKVPQVLTTLDATDQADSKNKAFSATNQGDRYQDYQLTQSFNWEVDLVGRIRRLSESARAGVAAQAQMLAHWQILTQAAVVQQYFILRGTQAQLASTEKNAERQRETWRLTQSRLDAGVATPIDVQRAKSQYYATAARIPPLKQTLKAAQHRLAVLTGQGTWTNLPSAVLEAAPMPSLPNAKRWVNDPTRILENRPDIVAAEQQLRQAVAQIGVAQAQWYPKISFLTDIGLAAESAGDLADGDSVFSLLGFKVQWAGLGMVRVNNWVHRAEADAEVAHAEYKKAVLLGFEEIENALVNYESAQAVTEHLALSAQAAKKAANLAQARYEGGVIDFIEVLDAEKRQLDMQTQLAAAQTQTAIAVVGVMRGLALR